MSRHQKSETCHKQGKGKGYKIFAVNENQLFSILPQPGQHDLPKPAYQFQPDWNEAKSEMVESKDELQYQSGFHLFQDLEQAKLYYFYLTTFQAFARSGYCRTLKLQLWEIEFDEKMYEGYEYHHPHDPITYNVTVANKLKPIQKAGDEDSDSKK